MTPVPLAPPTQLQKIQPVVQLLQAVATTADKIQVFRECATMKPSEDTSSTTNPTSEGTASGAATTTSTDPSEDQTTESDPIVDTDLSQKISLGKLI